MAKSLFILAISGTDLINYPGISAAGASQESLRYTAALDAEFIYHGECKTLDHLPVSPNGIVSPALIAKACLNLLDVEILIVDLGSHIKPLCPYLPVRDLPSGNISIEPAMTYEEAVGLFNSGKKLTEELKAKKYSEIIIAESVVGGTTTALGLLSALGYKCYGMLSSSFPQGNHEIKETIVKSSLAVAYKLNPNLQELIESDPLYAVAACGDPMQAWVAGLSIALNENSISCTLAGGTQMIAVKALIDSKTGLLSRATLWTGCSARNDERIKISTSPWIVEDKSASFKKLAALCCAGTYVDYAQIFDILNLPKLNQEIEILSQKSCARSLRLEEIVKSYSQGHVKEGTGMGALLFTLVRSYAKLSL